MLTGVLLAVAVIEAAALVVCVVRMRRHDPIRDGVCAPLLDVMTHEELMAAVIEAAALASVCEGKFPANEGKQTDEARHERVARDLSKHLRLRRLKLSKRHVNAITELGVCYAASGRLNG